MKKRQKRVKAAVDYLKEYINNYEKQAGYLDYTDKTIIDDMLYGLGRALHGDKCKWANGYDIFKEMLREHLGKQP